MRRHRVYHRASYGHGSARLARRTTAMKSRVLLAAAVGLLVLACSAKKEKTEIEGTWGTSSADKDTKMSKGPTKEDLANSKFTFSGDKVRMEVGEKKNEGTFKLDTSK